MRQILFVLILMMASVSFAQSYWVDDPNNCPTTYQSQTCTGSDVVCGYSGGITFCYDPASISPPASSATSNTDRSGSFNGGYLIDCYAYDGTAPHCDNSGSAWCDRNSTCYTTKTRDTTCTANIFGSSTCGSCRSGYQDCSGDDACEVQTGVTNCAAGANNNIAASCTCVCDSGYDDCDASGAGSGNGCEVQLGVTDCAVGANNNIDSCGSCVCDTGYLDCDGSGAGSGNGCEVQDGGACTVGGTQGTYDGCTCVVPKSNITTGDNITYFLRENESATIWVTEFNTTGYFLNLTNGDTGQSFLINMSGCATFMDGSVQCTAYGGSNSHLHSISNITNLAGSQQCSGTDKVKNVTITSSGLSVVCDSDQAGGGGSNVNFTVWNFATVLVNNSLNYIYFNFTTGLTARNTSNVADISLNSTIADGSHYDSRFINTDENAGGDVSGTFDSLAVGDNSHSHDGTTISGLDAGNDISSGTLADARLSSNVCLLSQANTFTGPWNYFVNINTTRINATSIMANLSNATFPFSNVSCSGTDKLTAVAINNSGQVAIICGSDQTGGGGGGGADVNFTVKEGNTVRTFTTNFGNISLDADIFKVTNSSNEAVINISENLTLNGIITTQYMNSSYIVAQHINGSKGNILQLTSNDVDENNTVAIGLYVAEDFTDTQTGQTRTLLKVGDNGGSEKAYTIESYYDYDNSLQTVRHTFGTAGASSGETIFTSPASFYKFIMRAGFIESWFYQSASDFQMLTSKNLFLIGVGDASTTHCSDTGRCLAFQRVGGTVYFAPYDAAGLQDINLGWDGGGGFQDLYLRRKLKADSDVGVIGIQPDDRSYTKGSSGSLLTPTVAGAVTNATAGNTDGALGVDTTNYVFSVNLGGFTNVTTSFNCPDGEVLQNWTSVPECVSNAGGGGATNFLGLSDTPSSYSGNALKFAQVNSAQNALVFTYAHKDSDCPAGKVVQNVSSGNSECVDLPSSGTTVVRGYTVQNTAFDPAQCGVYTLAADLSVAGLNAGDDVYINGHVFMYAVGATEMWKFYVEDKGTSSCGTVRSSTDATVNAMTGCDFTQQGVFATSGEAVQNGFSCMDASALSGTNHYCLWTCEIKGTTTKSYVKDIVMQGVAYQ